MIEKYHELGKHGYTVIYRVENNKYKIEEHKKLKDLVKIQANIICILNGRFMIKLNKAFMLQGLGSNYLYTLPVNYHAFMPERVKEYIIHYSFAQLYSTQERLNKLAKSKVKQILH